MPGIPIGHLLSIAVGHPVWHKARMKSLTQHLWFEVPNRRGFVNITDTVADLVGKSGVEEGLCLVNAMHITTCVAYLPYLQNRVSSKGLARFRLFQS